MMQQRIHHLITLLFVGGLLMAWTKAANAADQAELGGPAPLFSARTQEGEEFSLAERRGQGWTVLFFYPKADTPGCTKQACAFRDSIKVIEALNARVIGISADTVERQKKFHTKYQLRFTLLADPDGRVIEAFGAKLPLVTISKRWTFILDPELKIRWVEKDVDPALDAERVAAELKRLQAVQ